jgi:hypothetical protein
MDGKGGFTFAVSGAAGIVLIIGALIDAMPGI